ncbi:MAG: DUF2207 domain-containing protein [Solirubrobacterales bacterium]
MISTAKRIFYVIAAAAMIAAGVGLFYEGLRINPHASEFSGDNKSMFLPQVDSRFQVFRNGDLAVRETLNYDLGGTWHGLYQDIILNHGEQVKDVSVTRADDGVNLPFGPGSGIELGVGGSYGTFGYGVIDDNGRRLRIVWNVADSGTHTFVVRYALSGAVKNFRDASSLLWDVWGKGWETGVGRMDVSVRFPGRIKLFQPRTDHLQRRVYGTQTSGSSAGFSVRDLPAGNAVQMQAAAQPLGGMPHENKNVMPALRAEQARIAANNAEWARHSAELRERSFVSFLIPALISALIGLLFVWLCWLAFGRDTTKPISAGGTYQYPPEKIPAPVVAQALGGAANENLVSSTLLSLLQRDVFRVIPAEKRKEDVAIMNNVGETTFDRAKVLAWEAPIAELLQSAIDGHERHAPDFLELKKHLTPSEAETKIGAYTKAVKAERQQYELRSTYRGRVRRWFIGIVALIAYVIALIAIIGNSGNDAAARWDQSFPALFFIGFMPVLLWAAVEGNAFYRLRADQAERVRKWETYQDFFRNMDMSRDYPLTVEIWDEALVYAAAFGFAKKVITNMPRQGTTGSTDIGSPGLGWMAYNAAALSAFNGMSSGISGVTGMSTSSSSSGGFSGGASGGGGGGGW